MLGASSATAFIATSDFEAAKAFYQGKLGLELRGEDSFALMFDAGGTSLRVVKVDEVVVAPYTVLGWEVGDIRTSVSALTAAGVAFLRVPEAEQDELGIWTAPGGGKVAWFKDPEGHTLSVSQHPH